MTTTTIDQREPLVNRADRFLVAQLTVATVLVLTAVVAIDGVDGITLIRISTTVAGSLVAFELFAYALLLVINVASHRKPRRAPMPLREDAPAGRRRSTERRETARPASDGHTRVIPIAEHEATPAAPPYVPDPYGPAGVQPRTQGAWLPPVAPDAVQEAHAASKRVGW